MLQQGIVKNELMGMWVDSLERNGLSNNVSEMRLRRGAIVGGRENGDSTYKSGQQLTVACNGFVTIALPTPLSDKSTAVRQPSLQPPLQLP